MTNFSASNTGRLRHENPEDTAGLDDAEDLPLTPEEDMSVIPDEERVINVPS